VIVGAAVCPGAPFLVPGVADSLAAGSGDLVGACERAVLGLAGVDRIVLIAAGRRPVVRVFPPGAEVGTSPLRRSDLPPLSGPSPDFAVGSIVGRALLDRAFPGGVPAPVVTVETGDDPATARRAIDMSAGADRVGVLVISDGAAAHGDDAPGRRDDRSLPFDDMLADALATGDPGRLRVACADLDLARSLLAVVEPLLVLAELTAADPPSVADLRYRGAPYGVGYFVAVWRWGGR
jgi:hypothetical protein